MKNIWSWAGIAILIAILGWGGYYGWQQKGTLEGLRNELSDVRNQLTNQNNSLQNQISNGLENFTLPINQTTAPKDDRILITVGSDGLYDVSGDVPGPGCATDYNSQAPNTTILYSNSAKGIAISLPYNSSWGNSKYRVNPYDIGGEITPSGVAEGIIFGPIFPFEGCTLVRTYYLMFLPIKSAAQVVADLVAEDDLIKPITKNIGQLTVIEYESYGMCVYSHLIIVGQKSNYELNNGCGGKMSDLENIAKTIKLI